MANEDRAHPLWPAAFGLGLISIICLIMGMILMVIPIALPGWIVTALISFAAGTTLGTLLLFLGIENDKS